MTIKITKNNNITIQIHQNAAHFLLLNCHTRIININNINPRIIFLENFNQQNLKRFTFTIQDSVSKTIFNTGKNTPTAFFTRIFTSRASNF